MEPSLKLEDNPQVRDQLGLTLLRLGNPAAAAGCFDHVLADADGERLWMLYQLVVAYQAQGMHAEALDLLDRVETVFPAAAGVKDWRKLRTKSVKDRGRGRPVGKSDLLEGPRAGVSEGNRLKWLLPRLALPLILLAFAGWHTWRSVTLAAARPMYLVNGSNKPYTVAVNGTPYQLSPGSAKAVELPEGTLAFTPGPGAEGVEPVEVRVESSFWVRPYDGTRVVLNPDRLAVLVRETTIYAEVPPQNPPDEYSHGEALYQFSDINHCFEPFPIQVQAKKGQTVTRTRLGVVPITGAESRVSAVIAAGVSAAEQAEYGKRWLAADPDDPLALAWFAGTAPPAVALPVLKARLADRPPRVEWHRAYQTVTERTGGDPVALRADYRKLADELGRDPDALYLLAQVCDRAEAVALLTEATGSGRPAERGHYALGYRKLCEGEFAAAAAEMAKAGELVSGPAYRPVARDALLAAGRYAELLEQLAEEGNKVPALLERARVCEIAGDPAGADATAAALGQVTAPADAALQGLVQAAVTATRAAAKGDAAGYLAAADRMEAAGPIADRLRLTRSVADALLRGDRAAAESAAGTAADRGLILLATPPDAAEYAAAKQGFLDALAAGDRDEKRLKERLERGGSDGLTAVREALIPPKDKRVYAAAAAAWFPEQKAELLALARTLDFHRDGVSLALRKLTGGKPGKRGGR